MFMPVWVIITGSKCYAVCLLITTFHVVDDDHDDDDEGWTDTKRASERERKK